MSAHTIDALLDRVELQGRRIRDLERLLEQARRIAAHLEAEIAACPARPFHGPDRLHHLDEDDAA